VIINKVMERRIKNESKVNLEILPFVVKGVNMETGCLHCYGGREGPQRVAC
jgi:hypothetical protein